MNALNRSLVELALRYANWRRVSLWRVGHLAASRGSFFVDLRDGRRHCQTNTYSRVLQWFSDHWPAELGWPPDTPRPQPSGARPAAQANANRVTAELPASGLTADREALLSFKDRLIDSTGLNWSAARDLSAWDGVTTGGTPARVTQLEVSARGLKGTVAPELGNLAHLTRLWLADNQLTGPIPGELGRLTNLTSLALWGNGLCGPIPGELAELTNLTTLSLSRNRLDGPIPDGLRQLAI